MYYCWWLVLVGLAWVGCRSGTDRSALRDGPGGSGGNTGSDGRMGQVSPAPGENSAGVVNDVGGASASVTSAGGAGASVVSAGGAGASVTNVGGARLSASGGDPVTASIGGAAGAVAMTGGGSGAGPASGVQIWTDTSQHIEVVWSSYWTGSYRVEKQRSTLSAEQQRRLEALSVVEPSAACISDAPQALVTITEQDGTSRTYRAQDGDLACDSTDAFVGYAGLSAFLATFSCLAARQTGSASLDAAVTVTVDDACYHGLFNDDLATWWILVELRDAGALRVVIDSCSDRELQLQLFDETGTDAIAGVELVDPQPKGCPTLESEALLPGTYALQISMVGGTEVGDFYVSVQRAP